MISILDNQDSLPESHCIQIKLRSFFSTTVIFSLIYEFGHCDAYFGKFLEIQIHGNFMEIQIHDQYARC